MRYGVVIEKAKEEYSAYVPELPGCVATGGSVEETRARIQEAVAFHPEGMREDRVAIPAPRTSPLTVRQFRASPPFQRPFETDQPADERIVARIRVPGMVGADGEVERYLGWCGSGGVGGMSGPAARSRVAPTETRSAPTVVSPLRSARIPLGYEVRAR